MRRPSIASNVSRIGLALVVAALAAVAWSAAASGAPRASKPTLNVGIIQAPLSLDPASGAAGPYTPIITLEYDPLLKINAHGNLVGVLAKSWKWIGSGNNHIEITLKPNIHFADGTLLDANVVKAYFQYAGASARMQSTLGGPIADVHTIGQYTVDLTTVNPNPLLLKTFAGNWGFIPSAAGIATPANLASGAAGGAGPYEIVPSQTVSGSQYTFVPNPHYWQPKQQRYSQITVHIITSASSLLQAAETGQVEAAYGVTTTAYAAAKAGLHVYSAFAGINTIYITDRAGQSVKALADVRVREAMNLAIDRKTITRALNGKYGQPTSNIELGPGYSKSLDSYWKYDPTKAKQLLADAGYPDGFTFGVIAVTDPNDGSRILSAVAQYLKNVGITMNIFQPAVSSDFIQASQAVGKYQAVQLYTNVAGSGSSVLTTAFNTFLGPKANLNIYKDDDPTLDALAAQAQTAANPTVPMQAMAKRIITQGYEIPLFRRAFLWYVNTKKIGNFSMYPANPQPRIADWIPK
jgi:peptide/nickel transport system substrate-binding protein